MPAYHYAALDSAGTAHKGLLQGDSARQIRQQLRERGLTPLEVREAHGRSGPYRTQHRLSATELTLITRQLATLISAAVPLEQALAKVAEQADKPRLSALLLALRARVLEGNSLAQALDDFPQVFPEFYRATVAAGERAGYLAAVFERLADYTEVRQQLRQKVILALVYPLLLTLVAVFIVIGLMAYVVPQVVQVFISTGQALPWLTQALISCSQFLRDYGGLLVMALIVITIALSLLLRETKFRRRWHQLQLRLPLLGRLIRGLNSARFARTLSILSASRVPVLDALRISAQVMSNLALRAAIEQAALKVKEGSSLQEALGTQGCLPPLILQLIGSGEASGQLEAMLERAAQQQERETETLIGAILALFEPLLILIMGGVVLTIVLAILLPIFELNQMIQ